MLPSSDSYTESGAEEIKTPAAVDDTFFSYKIAPNVPSPRGFSATVWSKEEIPTDDCAFAASCAGASPSSSSPSSSQWRAFFLFFFGTKNETNSAALWKMPMILENLLKLLTWLSSDGTVSNARIDHLPSSHPSNIKSVGLA